jgi:DNA-directed RNA polymerase III subunit RPC2
MLIEENHTNVSGLDDNSHTDASELNGVNRMRSANDINDPVYSDFDKINNLNKPDDYGDLYNEEKLYDQIKNVDEKWKLIPAFLKVRGLIKQHIDSFNFFINVEIKSIVKAKTNYMVRSDSDPSFYLKYKDIRIDMPTIEEDFTMSKITPHECRLRDITYAAPIYVDIEYTKGGKPIFKPNVFIGKIPIMLGSTNCYLAGKNEAELAKMQECPYDPRGYFIVKGVEKVILIHEQMSKNRIIVEYDNKGNVCAQVTSSTHDTKSRTSLIYKNSKIYLNHNSFTDEIPICIMLRAMGVLSDQEIVQLIGSEFYDYLVDSLAEAHSHNVLSKNQATNFIAQRLKLRTENKQNLVIETLSTIIVAHVPVVKGNFNPKSRYLAHMVRRMLEGVVDPSKVDDKDYYGNKRLELAGQLVSLLFEDLFKKFNSDLKKNLDINLARDKSWDVYPSFRTETITYGLIHAISTGNWNVKRFKMKRSGITQVLGRISYIAALGMMTRINSQFEKTRKISGPRSLQPSQWGMICPSDTPDGESCGLVKNLALISHVTTDQPDRAISNLAINLGVEDISLVTGEEINSSDAYLVYINGEQLGIHRNPEKFCRDFRRLRRCGVIHEFVSVSKNDIQRNILIACDNGRLTRPLLLVENGKVIITKNDIRLISLGIKTFKDLVQEGIVEYLDVNEENDALIALTEEQIKPGTTHVEIAPFSILGVVSGLIPYPHHNQSPRNTYQCAMGKQAIGAIGYNQMLRVDTVLYLMVYPQKPLVKTVTIELSNYEKLPAGHNASVAIMSYSGYDIEDAVILNKASLDRGFGRVMVVRRQQVEMKKFGNMSDGNSMMISEIRKGPEKNEKENFYKKKNATNVDKKLHAIDKDGLPFIGEKLHSGDIYINKFTPTNSSSTTNEISYSATPVVYKGAVPSYVDRVLLTTTPEEPELIKVILRQTRRPELGDKFSSRHGQKGVVGLIVNQEDMPFSENGWCPDLIMNPHGFPSRMTVGKLIELLAGKSAVLDGKLKYGTAFAGDRVNDVGKILTQNGFSFTGKDFLYSGVSGEPIECAIYSGPIFYQRLKHMVVDKMHARARGPKALLTRQPTEGRSKEGGLRLGEMERDCLIGYGASCLLLERLMISSDLFLAHICSNCGFLAASKFCSYCNDVQNIFPIKLPYAFKLLTQELLSMNIKTKFKLKDI